MSSIVRHELEDYIDNQKRSLSRLMRKALAEVITSRSMDLVTKIEALEGMLQVFKPSKARYLSPEEYIDALRAHAFVMSLIQIVLSEGINEKNIDIALKLIELAKSGAPIGKIAEDAKLILAQTGKEDLYLRGCMGYLNVLVGKIREFDPQEIFIAKEALLSILNESRPIITLADLSKLMGVREKDLKALIEKIGKSDQNVIVGKKYLFIKDALKDYLMRRLEEKKYVLVSELAKEWALRPSEVVNAILEIKDIFPDLLLVDKTIVITPKSFKEYVLEILESRYALSVRELSASMGIKDKTIRKVLSDLLNFVPGLVLVNNELIVMRDRLKNLLEEIFGNRISIYVDEVAGRLGVSVNTAKLFTEFAERLTGVIVVSKSKNKVYHREKLSQMIAQSIFEGKELPIEKIDVDVKLLMEDEVYRNIARALEKFAEKVGIKA